jgi:membrane protease YdiL (CAAX protease family)
MSFAKYLKTTLHPWPCLVFMLPLLAAYEAGILWVGGTEPDAIRNGADTWLHWGLETFGLSQLYWGPVLLALGFAIWTYVRWPDRPKEILGVCTGMAIESMLFAVGLLGLSRILGPLLDSFGIVLGASAGYTEPIVAQALTFVGAGIFEEVLFRMLLYGGMRQLLFLAELKKNMATIVAALVSAVLFSAAHHVGPYGDTFEGFVFLFRILAGLYFTALYQKRGFGITVGAHTCYDVLAGIVMN